METRFKNLPATDSDRRRLKTLSQVIEERRATNHFTDASISDEDLDTILRCAAQAPSGYNLQPWRFIVVRELENRKRLQKVSFDQEKISEAAAVIIFLGMKEETKKWASDVFYEGVRRGLGKVENVEKNLKGAVNFITGFGMKTWVNKHVMISFSFAMLMAESLGYDTAPMEGFEPDKLKKEFEIPEDAEVIALLAIGRTKEPDKAYPGRFPLERIAFAEKYGAPLSSSAKSESQAGGSQQSKVKCCGEDFPRVLD